MRRPLNEAHSARINETAEDGGGRKKGKEKPEDCKLKFGAIEVARIALLLFPHSPLELFAQILNVEMYRSQIL